MLYLSFKFGRKFKFCVSPLVKRYPQHVIDTRCLCTVIENFKVKLTAFVSLILFSFSFVLNFTEACVLYCAIISHGFGRITRSIYITYTDNLWHNVILKG